MKDQLKKGYIEDRAANGEFGEYLQSPMSQAERTAAVGRKMLICRKKAGLSQGEVCAIIGLAPQTYSGYENGKHEPTIETLVRLSFLYCVSLDFLLDRSNGDEEFYKLLEEHENLTENESLKELAADVHFLKEEIAILKKSQK